MSYMLNCVITNNMYVGYCYMIIAINKYLLLYKIEPHYSYIVETKLILLLWEGYTSLVTKINILT